MQQTALRRQVDNEDSAPHDTPRPASSPWDGRTMVPVSEEAFRLAAQLRAALRETDKTLLFTGAGGQEGTSTITAQVALACAKMDLGPVLLVDANFHTPSVHVTMQVPQSPGFTDLLAQHVSMDQVLHATDVRGLSVLPTGSTTREALALCSSATYAAVLHLLEQRFRLIMLDTAPVLQHVETTMCLTHTDGVVLIVAAGVRRQTELREMKRLLDSVKARLLGVVLSDKTGRLT